jgi:hypothetical protein
VTAHPRGLAPAPARQRLLSAIWIATASLLAATLVGRLAVRAEWQWWFIPAALAGILLADLLSGLVHWAADTWGRSDLPVIGPRFLLPFRVHHVNPDDFLGRDVLDTNGDLAAITIPALVLLHALPLATGASQAFAVGGLSFCIAGGLTNQIHQWAHLPHPPRLIRAGQRLGLLLDRDAHAGHHAAPFDGSYCITTGWCNRPLERVAAFRRLERGVTSLTGWRPRGEEEEERRVANA